MYDREVLSVAPRAVPRTDLLTRLGAQTTGVNVASRGYRAGAAINAELLMADLDAAPQGARGRIDMRLRRVGATSHDAPADENDPSLGV